MYKELYPVYITPSPPHFTHVIASVWPVRQMRHFLVVTSHIRASPSLLALTKRRHGALRCTGSQEIPVIHFLWPCNMTRSDQTLQRVSLEQFTKHYSKSKGANYFGIRDNYFDKSNKGKMCMSHKKPRLKSRKTE